MENENMFRSRILRNENLSLGVTKLEARVKSGPVVQRAALGNIHNRPALLLKNGDNKSNAIQKKSVLVPSIQKLQTNTYMKNSGQNNKENLPIHQEVSKVKEKSIHHPVQHEFTRVSEEKALHLPGKRTLSRVNEEKAVQFPVKRDLSRLCEEKSLHLPGKKNLSRVEEDPQLFLVKDLSRVSEEEKMETEEEVEIQELSVAFSTHILNVKDIDSDDTNPQLVPEYVKDIYKYLWEIEDAHIMREKYLEGHKITSRMRSILIDWLVQVHQRFTLLQETLYLTVAIIDRYLQIKKDVTKDSLQLVGVTALYISSKYEEMQIPEIGDFAYITDKTFTKKQIRLMEIDMFSTLGFCISFPLPLHFLRRDSKAAMVESKHHILAKYIMELTIVDYGFCHYKASLIAAAALLLAMRIVGSGYQWDDVMAYYSNYKEEQLLPVVYEMAALLITSQSSKQQAVRNKYRSPRFMKISENLALRSSSQPLKSLAAKAKSSV